MKTLLERLKPEYLEILENEKTKFPYLIKIITKTLKNNHYFTELQIREICYLMQVFNILFDISEIDNLFTKYEH